MATNLRPWLALALLFVISWLLCALQFGLFTGSTVPSTPITTTPSQTPWTEQAPWSPRCVRNYTAQPGDTCNSIALANNVSTDDLMWVNGMFGWCDDRNLRMTGRRRGPICIPEPCPIHKIEYGDTCDSIADMYGISMPDLLGWNRLFDDDCEIMNPRTCLTPMTDWVVCVGWWVAPY